MEILCTQPSLSASEARYLQSLLKGAEGIDGYEAARLREVATRARNTYALQLLVTYGSIPEYTTPGACALGLALRLLWSQGVIILLESEGSLLNIPALCRSALIGECPETLDPLTMRACDAAGNSALVYCVVGNNITLFELLLSYLKEEPDTVVRELCPMQLLTSRSASEHPTFYKHSALIHHELKVTHQGDEVSSGSITRYSGQQQYELHDPRRFRAAKQVQPSRGNRSDPHVEESEDSDPYVSHVRQMYAVELARGGSLRGACYTARALLDQVKILADIPLIREYWDSTTIPTTSLTVLDFELYSLESGLISELGAVKAIGSRPIFVLQGFLRPETEISNTLELESVVSITGIEYCRTEETKDAYDAPQFLRSEDRQIFDDLQTFIYGSISDLRAWLPTIPGDDNGDDDPIFTTLCRLTLPDLVACRRYTRPSGLSLLHFEYAIEFLDEYPPLYFKPETPIVLGKGVNTERECLKSLGIVAELVEIQQFFAPILNPQTAESLSHQEVAPSRLYCAGHRALLTVTRRTPILGHFHCALDDCLQYLLAIRRAECENHGCVQAAPRRSPTPRADGDGGSPTPGALP
ncbi:hypothetical protein GMRT_14151 [Giardia muris]|uniref:Uncharacterized protein n=1 Tax=Giardia muris TaxID=5742 RepID=A0A4Z1SN81_GIAMU|nr:hypothetical protein GMRT_14151 [Giardia muris]|eukprot:TNJ27060.1 hypothetical protein GMRT_14151 [Giardia muris]